MGQSSLGPRSAPAAVISGLSAAPRGPTGSSASLAAAVDTRADGYRRTVSLSRDCVRIDRRVQGIAMRVAVPVTAYRGVALTLRADADGAVEYGLHLLHRDADLSVTLDRACDDNDIVADWRLWSRFFRLPALVERHAGLIEEADLSLGGLRVGTAKTGRRPARFRSKRRPAFLGRRKPGVPRQTVLNYAGEREIVARN